MTGFHEEYKVHGQLSLLSMIVSDVDNVSDPTQCSLYIEHPYKSFIITFKKPTLKMQWLRDIQQTCNTCFRRAEMTSSSINNTSNNGTKSPISSPSRVSNNNTGDSKRIVNAKRVKSLTIDLLDEKALINRSSINGPHDTSITNSNSTVLTPAQIENNEAILRAALSNTPDRHTSSVRLSIGQNNTSSGDVLYGYATSLDTTNDLESASAALASPSTLNTSGDVSSIESSLDTESDYDSDDDDDEDEYEHVITAWAHDKRKSLDLRNDPDYNAL